MEQSRKLVLASASPRRRQLLSESGYEFQVVASKVDESQFLNPDLAPDEVAIQTAAAKARDIARQIQSPAIVLGADTIVVCENSILGKADDADQARKMLYTLSRTRHRVITGLAFIETRTGREVLAADTAWITMRPMSHQEIEDYIASGSWIDKAGAYAVQEGADRFIIRIDGSYTNVVGLPMERVTEILTSLNIFPVKS